MTNTGEVPKTLSENHFNFLKKQTEVNPRISYTKGIPPISHSNARLKQEQAKKRQTYQHIRDVAKKEMSDLAKLAEMLPDKQYDQLFSTEVKEFTKLLKILLTTSSKITDSDMLERQKISETRRISMLKLLDWLLWEIGAFPNAITLAEKSHQILMMAGLNEFFLNIFGIKAIMIEADRECDTTVYKKRLKLPGSIAQRMEMEGRHGFESGRP